MARIVIDARILNTSTGRYVERLLAYLQAIDRDNQYIVLLLARDFERWRATAPNFSTCIADYPPFRVSGQFQLARLLHRLGGDLVHFTTPERPFLYRRPYVVTIHDLTLVDFVNRREEGPLRDWYKQSIKPRAFRWLLRDTLRSAAHLITPTDYVRRQLIERFGVEPSRVSRTYEAAEPLAPEPSPIERLVGASFVLSVGNAFPYKNLERLIDAVAELKDRTLVLAGGPGYFHERLREYVARRGHRNVEFVVGASDAQLAWLYQNAEIYVFPSLSEGFGLPGLEAMRYGLPVAAANASCLPEVYAEAAVYFDPNSTENMTRVIGRTLAERDKLARLRSAGLARASQFSWKRMAEQTLAIYQAALRGSAVG